MVPSICAAATLLGLQPLASTPAEFAALVGLNGLASALPMPPTPPCPCRPTPPCPPPSNRRTKPPQVGLNGLASALSMPSISPLILDHVSDNERSQALAMRQMAQDTGALCGAATVGVVASAHGIPAAIQMVAGLQLVAVGFFAVRAPWKKRAP